MASSPERVCAARHSQTARKLAEAGDLPGAIAEMDRALLEMPNSASHLTTKGHFLRENGDLESAKVTLRQAVDIDPTYHVAWTQLGLAYQDLGLPEHAAVC